MMSKSQVSDFLLLRQKTGVLLYLNNRYNNVTKSSGNLQPGVLGGNNYFGLLRNKYISYNRL